MTAAAMGAKMRGTMAATLVLALGACAEHSGWNPNYGLGDGTTPYSRYLTHREAALQGKVEPSRTIPIARPFKAPTAEDIAGPPKTRAVVVAATPATVPTAPVVVTRGPYPGSTPVLAAYAARVTHTPGTAVWQRPGADASRALRACRSYASADAAQIGFLARGGPEADPIGMDPDGDGFVCGWNSAPWRQAAR